MFRRLTLPVLLIAAFACSFAVLAVPKEAQAAPNADTPSIVPIGGHCFGEVGPSGDKCEGPGVCACVAPDLSFNVYRVKLNGGNAGKMDVGVAPVGLGYALLFGYDQWWASGLAAHAILDLSQSDANRYEGSITITALRYGHAGVAASRNDGFLQWYAVAGLSVPVDLLTQGLVQQKAKASRLARAAPQS